MSDIIPATVQEAMKPTKINVRVAVEIKNENGSALHEENISLTMAKYVDDVTIAVAQLSFYVFQKALNKAVDQKIV